MSPQPSLKIVVCVSCPWREASARRRSQQESVEPLGDYSAAFTGGSASISSRALYIARALYKSAASLIQDCCSERNCARASSAVATLASSARRLACQRHATKSSPAQGWPGLPALTQLSGPAASEGPGGAWVGERPVLQIETPIAAIRVPRKKEAPRGGGRGFWFQAGTVMGG